MARLMKEWRRKRVTTYLAEENATSLRAISDAAGVPMSKIMDQALDRFFSDIEWRETPSTAPVNLEHYKDAAAGLQEEESTST